MSRKAGKPDWVTFRILLAALFFAVVTVALMVRAYKLQIADRDDLRKLAEKQRTKLIHLEARRGSIFDRSGDQIAVSLEVSSVYAKPKRVPDKKESARILAQALEMDAKEIQKKLDEDKTFVWLRRCVSPVTAEKIRKADIPGIMIGTEYQRFYPSRSFASHVIGFAGLDSTGLEGLELFYDQDLKVDPIPVTAQRDALGRPVIFSAGGQDPKRRDIHITMDRNIQHIAERELEEGVKANNAKAGAAVVMDADSGEILALAVRPTFNLNIFHKATADVRRNRAVADAFEPGSTFKVFLAASALELGKITPGEMIDCANGVFKYNGAEIHDVTPHKMLSFEDVIVHSSNIGVVKISEKLKKSELYRLVNGFGFGTYSGVDLPGERPGVVPLPSKWSVLTKANMAFGQGITVNAVQMCAAFAAAVNGGSLYRPHFMRSINNALGETIREHPQMETRRVIREETSRKLVEILREAVTRGTGKSAAIPGADVVGKTGTAQKADPNGGYSQDRYVASFIGALMGSKPRMVIFVMLDEPAGKIRTGGKAAAPVFRKIGEAVLASCGALPPAETEAAILAGKAAPKKPVLHGAPPKAVALRKGAKPGEWVVPDLKGLDMRQVIEICGQMKCDASFQGVGVAAEQDPKPGITLREGGRLTVSFESPAG